MWRVWMWRAFWALSCLALVGTGVIGLRNGIVEWPGAHTLLQKSVTAGVELYGVLGVVAGVGLAMRKRWSAKVALAWAVVVSYVPGAAVMGYGGSNESWGAALAATLGAGVTAAAIVYVAYRETRVERVERI